MKTDFPAEITAHSSDSPEGLELKQRDLYDLLIGHYGCLLGGVPDKQLLISLDSKAGTGKSHVIMLISSVMEHMASQAGIRKCPIVRAAPTGVAAYGISGMIHAFFQLPVKTASILERLTPQNLQALQQKFDGVYYIIIDEKSMIGLRQLSWIDQRCREIFPVTNDMPFGGLNIVPAGDFSSFPR
jgi:hypothetical protein